MTTEELNTIVQAVVDKINEQVIDFDVVSSTPESTDLLSAVRSQGDGTYQGVTLKWDDVANAVTREAKGYRDDAASAKTNVENMKASVEQTVSDFNTLAEEKKQEVQGVYQTDLNELKGDLDNKLPKSPVNWEPWTDEEQASAREKMGIPNGYELIEETTLQEDVTLFSRSQEPDGTPYRFSAFCIIADVIVSDSETGNYLRVDASSKETPNIFLEYFYREDIKNKRINVTYEALSPNIFRLSTEINDKSGVVFTKGNVSVRNRAYDLPFLGTIVNYISISNITLCAGTKIKIYGVRA